jgi:hypothetical protein
MARPGHEAQAGALAVHLLRHPAIVTDLIQRRQHPCRSVPSRDGVLQELAHRDQDRVDPARLPNHRRKRATGSSANSWPLGVAQPQHVRAQPIHGIPPVPVHLPAPQQIERDHVAYALVVLSTQPRPNRRCRKKSSAARCIRRSRSSTVQYRTPTATEPHNVRTRPSADHPVPDTSTNAEPSQAPTPSRRNGVSYTCRIGPRRDSARHRIEPSER